MARGTLGPNPSATKLANMAGVSTAGAPASVRVGVDEQADRRFANCVLQIEEMRQDGVSVEVDGDVDDAIAGMGPKAVLTPAGLGDMAKAAQVLDDQVSLKEAGDSSDANLGHGVGRSPPINQGVVVGGPWDPRREAVQNRLIDGRRGESHSQKVCGWYVENIHDLINSKFEVVDEESIPLVS